MAYLNTTTAHQSTALSHVAAFFEGVVARIKLRRLTRETYEGLSALNNRQLADLGLSRSELRAVASESARRALA
ncbi:MAG: DUF1127 domain-containing protein [Sulfitobacter sp.]